MEKKKRPKVTYGNSEKIVTGCGSLYVTPNYLTPNKEEGTLIEVFATLGKTGGCATCQLEGMTRAISLGLRYGVPVEEYIKELQDIKCPNQAWDSGRRVLSCSDAIADVLSRELNRKEK